MPVSEIKKKALHGATKLALSPAVLKLLANPNVQRTFLAMINANADFRDWMDERMRTIARSMSLVTRDELGAIRRSQRDQIAELEIMADRIAELEGRIAKVERAQKAPKAKPAARASSTRSSKSGAKTRATTTKKKSAPKKS